MKIFEQLRFLIILILCIPVFVLARVPKPKLLVYGSTLEAYTAALQASASGISTVWINPRSYNFEIAKQQFELSSQNQLDGGVISRLYNTTEAKEGADNANFFSKAKQSTNHFRLNNPLLEIIDGVDVERLQRTKSWKCALKNKLTFDVEVIIDAGLNNDLFQKSNLSAISGPLFHKSIDLSIEDSRVVMLVGERDSKVYAARLQDLITQKDNYFVVSTTSFENESFRMAYGQVMGAIGGYCAFFKTTVDKIDIRTLQNEILGYGARLLPFLDISAKDRNFESVQRFYLSGILKPYVDQNNSYFNAQDSIRVDEVKTIIQKFYSRAQLWFVDNQSVFLSVGGAVNLIKYTAFRGDELDLEVKNDWSKILSFKGDYNPSKPITRYEFAVLFDKYATPFVKKISQDGAVIYR